MKKILSGTAVVLALAGCAKDGETGAEPPSSPPLTKAELIKQGDAICKASNRRLEALTEADVDSWKVAADIRSFVREQFVPELEKQIADLRSLEPPREDVPRIEVMLAAAEEGIAKLEKEPVAEIQKDTTFDRANRFARKYGFKECSK